MGSGRAIPPDETIPHVSTEPARGSPPVLPPLWQNRPLGAGGVGLAGAEATGSISRHLRHVTERARSGAVERTKDRGSDPRSTSDPWEAWKAGRGRKMGWKGERETQGRRTGPPTNRHRVATEDKRSVGRRLVDEIVGGMERRQKATSHRTPRHARAEWYLSHRDGLVDWMVVAAEDLSLSGTTLATAVYCMDRTLSKVEVGLGKLYLVAASCLMVAAKFEEREVDVPSLKSLHNYMGRMYSIQSFVNMEKHVLKATSWKIACCSYAHCLDTYMSLVCEPPMSKEQESRARVCSARDKSDLGKTASVTMTHALYSTEILDVFKPSAVAVAVLMVSMDHLGWDADLQTVILTGIGDWCFDQEIVRISRVIQLVCRLKFPEHCVMQDLITGGFSQSTMGVASTSPKSTLDMNALQIG